MKQTPLTNMENRWVHSTKEAFYALVAMGYVQMSPYNKKMEILEVYSSDNGISDPYNTCQLSSSEYISYKSKQAYYHNGHFYDQPYEEFTITEEKVPFTELEDIEYENGSLKITLPKWFLAIITSYIENLTDDEYYNISKSAYENGVHVSWKLKEKINRKLH